MRNKFFMFFNVAVLAPIMVFIIISLLKTLL